MTDFFTNLDEIINEASDEDITKILRSMAGLIEGEMGSSFQGISQRTREYIVKLYDRFSMPGFGYMINKFGDTKRIGDSYAETKISEQDQVKLAAGLLKKIMAQKKYMDRLELERSSVLSPNEGTTSSTGSCAVDYETFFRENLPKLSAERVRRLLVSYFDQNTFKAAAILDFGAGWLHWLQDPELFKDLVRSGKSFLLFKFKENNYFMECLSTLTSLKFDDELANLLIENGEIALLAGNIRFFAGLGKAVFEALIKADLSFEELEQVYIHTQAFNEAEVDQREIKEKIGPKIFKLKKTAPQPEIKKLQE